MGSFTKLHISGFRRLLNLDLELRPLAVLIGANGSGKTSLLDVLSLLAASASENLSERISDFGGIGTVLTNDRASKLEFGLWTDSRIPLSFGYSLTLSPKAVAYEIAEELLVERQGVDQLPPIKYLVSMKGDTQYFDRAQNALKPNWEMKPLETALSQVPKTHKETEAFRKLLASFTYYRSLRVEPHAPVTMPQPLRPATLPGRNGEDLVSCLFYMRETDRDRFEDLEAVLRSAFPGFQRLEFPPVAAGTLSLGWNEKRFNTPVYLHQLSEGTLRFLWLLALLQSPGLATFTLLDEPEVSLHPELLSILAELLREASARTQIVVATHSDRLVSLLKPEEVVVMDLNDDGMATATWADQMDLDAWLREYTLGEVWQLGRMGGRA